MYVHSAPVGFGAKRGEGSGDGRAAGSSRCGAAVAAVAVRSPGADRRRRVRRRIPRRTRPGGGLLRSAGTRSGRRCVNSATVAGSWPSVGGSRGSRRRPRSSSPWARSTACSPRSRPAGLSQRSVVRALDRRADGVVAERLGLEASTPLIYLERLRLAGEAPLALDRVWLPADYAEPLLTPTSPRPACTASSRPGSASGRTAAARSINAVIPTAAERALLESPAGAALLDPPARPGPRSAGGVAAHGRPRRPVRPHGSVRRCPVRGSGDDPRVTDGDGVRALAQPNSR